MDVVAWLLDADPAIRWQVLRDLTAAPSDEVAVERARVAREGWGAQVLAARGPDGRWGGGTFFPRGTGTFDTLHLLRAFGVDAADASVQRAVAPVHEAARWDHDPTMRFFDGEVEPCINGRVVAIGVHFGRNVDGVVDRLLGEQMGDGGWNCEQERGSTRGSFDTTLNVLEGLLAYEEAAGPQPDVTRARRRGEEYLLERRLLHRLTDGVVPEPRWLRAGFPDSWEYDVARVLDHFRRTAAPPDPRTAEALDVLASKRTAGGRWLLDARRHAELHADLGDVEGQPSRWITLRALRVLRWAGAPV